MSRTNYPIHPDFKKWTKFNPLIKKALLPITQKLMGNFIKFERSSKGITVSQVAIPNGKGGVIQGRLYSPVGIGGNLPCLLYYHGGGFVFTAMPHHFRIVREYALRAGCKVILVDYRLAPKYPFPAAPDDCYAAYSWILANGVKLAIDPSRIAVGGDSAGGELATVVCLMARDRGQTIPCAQMLIYPVTGRGVATESMTKYTDTPMCNSRDMEKYYRLYIQDPAAGKPEYASPYHAESLGGLPPAYLETAEFDCLRDEGILYGERLRAFGVPVEINNTIGTMHGFDVVLDSPIVRGCFDSRIRFLRTSFKRQKD